MESFADALDMVTALRPEEPVYCLRPKVLAETADRFIRAFPGTVMYAVKCNDHPAVLAGLHAGGLQDFDVASLAEIAAAAAVPGAVLHYMGDHIDARRHTERMLASYVPPVHRSHTIRFQYDQGVLARGILARILWLQGFADQAMSLAQSNVEGARATGHAISLCYALAQAACPVAFWVGDLAAAENSVAMLLEHSDKHALPVWQAWGRSLYGVLLIKRGEVARGLPVLKSALDEQPRGLFADFNPDDRSAGRPAVTYRELRAAFGVDWVVTLDRGVRIAIGCQHAVDQPDPDPACERAVRTAHLVP